jgi:hypothetical protein
MPTDAAFDIQLSLAFSGRLPAFALRIFALCVRPALLPSAVPTFQSLAPQGTRSGHSGQRGTLISGRFRDGKLVGSGRYSKCFLPGQLCFFAGA